jgi:hypothetical protein
LPTETSVPDTNQIFAADGELNVRNVYDGTSYELVYSELVFEQGDADHDELAAKVPSVPGASAFFVPECNGLYIPSPPNAGKSARLPVNETQP